MITNFFQTLVSTHNSNGTDRLVMPSENNFNLLRLAAALCVVITHSYALVGLPEKDVLNQVTRGLVSFSQLGLYSFFIISGFLVYASLIRSSSITSFFKKRARRIFPALIIVVLCTVFILGPLMTNLSVGNYINNQETYRYLGAIGLYRITYTLPGVFTHNPYPGAVNGSLWTLPYEWTCYVVLACTYRLIRRKPRLVLALGVLCALAIRTLVGRYQVAQVIPFLHLDVRQFMLFSALFTLGALAYEMRTVIPFRGSIAVVLVGVVWIVSDTKVGLYALLGILPYVVLVLARARLSDRITRFVRHADFSYGFYVYAFPVGQILVSVFGHRISVVGLVLATIAAAAPFAIMSWYFVEKPMLRYKVS
jgi:peptidoglycan/LPS O-acetylase OafA/YrhL